MRAAGPRATQPASSAPAPAPRRIKSPNCHGAGNASTAPGSPQQATNARAPSSPRHLSRMRGVPCRDRVAYQGQCSTSTVGPLMGGRYRYELGAPPPTRLILGLRAVERSSSNPSYIAESCHRSSCDQSQTPQLSPLGMSRALPEPPSVSTQHCGNYHSNMHTKASQRHDVTCCSRAQ